MRNSIGWVSLAAVLFCLSPARADPAPSPRPWLDPKRAPEERATLAVAAMTLDEKIRLLHGVSPLNFKQPPGETPSVSPPEAIASAGFVPGVPRLGIPNLYETDASLGIANPREARTGDVATALPAGLALAATFDPALAYRAGALLGNEARAKGFNVLLGGGMDLTRDPRNGRNFEYLGEDPLLAGALAGEAARGTQQQHVIATVKHFALNANETNRGLLDARIDAAALRESDLLAFQIAIERGSPGSVMCAYNKVNGAYSCSNDWLLNQVLKHDWGYPGWVMSDWGAVHGLDAARKGLDQQSGEQFDTSVWFDAPLKAAALAGTIPQARVDEMAHRILRSMFAVGIVDHPPLKTDIDYAAHGALALEIAQKGIVLLKNQADLLPLAPSARRIAVIGGFADLGVLSGGGSSQVIPAGKFVRIPAGSHGEPVRSRTELFDLSAPYKAVQLAAPQSEVSFDAGDFPADAADTARRADVAIVFVTRHESEGYDIPDLELPDGQNALIEAVAAANPHTIVVLETGNPVAMPWLDKVGAVLAAWYPGQEGGQAIADILFGSVNPSGRLPLSFPKHIQDFVRPTLPNLGLSPRAPASIDYTEGADVGYRWYSAHSVAPLFAFGFGLSYTRFEYDRMSVTGGKMLSVSFLVRNVGTRAGADVPQVYLSKAGGESVLRLIGFERVELAPGESRKITVSADSRLLASFDEAQRTWLVKRGIYQARVGRSADDLTLQGEARIDASRLPP
jgi:beta-glucosidase